GVRAHAALERLPSIARHEPVEHADVEVVLDVDRHGLDDVGRVLLRAARLGRRPGRALTAQPRMAIPFLVIRSRGRLAVDARGLRGDHCAPRLRSTVLTVENRMNRSKAMVMCLM